jgi:thioredoxin-like negative regulator of GroEL
MNPFGQYPALVVCWKQQECPACAAFVGKFRQTAQRYSRCIPSAILDCHEHDQLSDAYRVRHTPTVMVIRYGRPSLRRIEGDRPLSDLEIFYAYAARGMECAL